MIQKKNPLNKQYSFRTDWLNPFSKLATVFWNNHNWLKPFLKLAAVFWNNWNWLKPFLKLAAVFWNNQNQLKSFSKLAAVFWNSLNWLKPFLKLAAVFNILKTAASFGTQLSGKWKIGTICEPGQYAASPNYYEVFWFIKLGSEVESFIIFVKFTTLTIRLL